MYIHLGGEYVVKEDEVIGIFDLENTTISKHTRSFLEKSEKRKEQTRSRSSGKSKRICITQKAPPHLSLDVMALCY